jgi:hypothetical protein
VFDDTFASLEDETLNRVMFAFKQHGARTTLVLVGRSTQAQLPLFTRVLHLAKLADEKAAGEPRRSSAAAAG